MLIKLTDRIYYMPHNGLLIVEDVLLFYFIFLVFKY